MTDDASNKLVETLLTLPDEELGNVIIKVAGSRRLGLSAPAASWTQLPISWDSRASLLVFITYGIRIAIERGRMALS